MKNSVDRELLNLELLHNVLTLNWRQKFEKHFQDKVLKFVGNWDQLLKANVFYINTHGKNF